MWNGRYHISQTNVIHAFDTKNEKATTKENALCKAPPLTCLRYDDPPGDDMDEVDPPPYWNELTCEEKLDILDAQMDDYWNEILPDINWWRLTAIGLAISNLVLLLKM